MDAVSQIKQKLDIVDVISSYVNIKKAGKSYKGACPFHSENTPSFIVSPDLQIFKCFGCGESGDMFSFIQKIEGVDFGQALEKLADKAGVVLEKTDFDHHSQLKQKIYYVNELTAKFYNYILLKHSEGKKALDYVINKRKLTKDTARDFMIGYAPPSGSVLKSFLLKRNIQEDTQLSAGVIVSGLHGGYIDKFRGRITFPFVSTDGKVVGFTGRTIFDREPKYLNTTETAVFQKSTFLYALNKAKLPIKKKGAVFVEGQMDVISAHQAGFDNVIASSGTSITESQLKLLSRYTKDIVLCMDSDPAGVSAAFRAASLAEKQDFNIKVAVLPEDCKDIDDLIQKGKQEAESMLSHTIPAYDYFLLNIIRRHDRNSSEGKKKIMEEISESFSLLTNPVLIDHYSSEIAKELNLSKDTVSALLSKNKGGLRRDTVLGTETDNNAGYVEERHSPEYYYLSLLLKLGTEDYAEYGKQLPADSLTSPALVEVYKLMLSYSDKGPDFDAGCFEEELSPDTRVIFRDLYLAEPAGTDTSRDGIIKELASVVVRIRKEGARRELRELSEKIRLAEKENNDKLLAELTASFDRVSKELL